MGREPIYPSRNSTRSRLAHILANVSGDGNARKDRHIYRSKLIETVAKIHMPLGRPQTPEEIGEAVLYFCKADSTSGQALVIDGGHAMW